MKKQEIIEEVRQLKERLALLENQLKASQEELKEKYIPWIPEPGERFFYITAYGEVDDSRAFYHPYIVKLSNNHNLFKTKELAESRKHLSPLQRKWAFILDYLERDESFTSFEPETIEYHKFILIYDNEHHIINFSRVLTTQHLHKSQYATSEEMCKKAIEIMGDDIYPYLGVKKP